MGIQAEKKDTYILGTCPEGDQHFCECSPGRCTGLKGKTGGKSSHFIKTGTVPEQEREKQPSN